MKTPTMLRASATFDETRAYRFTLSRVWDEQLPQCAFVGLNPSTATETEDDPTVRRCIVYARDWGFGSLLMLNLFAYRATDPRKMIEHYTALQHPECLQQNFDAILGEASKVLSSRLSVESELSLDVPRGIIICAWGNHGSRFTASRLLREQMAAANIPVHHLGLTKIGEPRHPLYLKKTLTPVRWK